jgi:putative SOS response-associated peptidase YedK
MCRANVLLTPFTDRMPVVLEKVHLDLWLDRNVTDPAAVLALLAPAAEHVLTYRESPSRMRRGRRRPAANGRPHTPRLL